MTLTELGRRLVIQPQPLGTTDITIIGCGGIGARILPALVRMLTRPVNIYLWDHDVVEVKNLLRQNFTLPDVGKPKAQVLADRYRTTLAHTVAKVERWEEARHGLADGLVISAVDDWATRKALFDHAYWPLIDCGNDGLRGQVLLGGVLDGFNLRTIDTFTELITEPTEAQRLAISCEAGDTQTVVANQMAATLALVYVDALTKGRPLGHIGLMYSLPHGMWEIPVASVVETWRGMTLNEKLTVYPGWMKSSASYWMPPLDGKGIYASVIDEANGWTSQMEMLVENKLYGAGGERGCMCENCLPLIKAALAEMGLTQIPEPMQSRWGSVPDQPTQPTTRRYGGTHRSSIRVCTQCGDNYRYGRALDAGVNDPYQFCSQTCEEQWQEENPDPDNEETNDDPDEEPEPMPDPDEDEETNDPIEEQG